MIEIIKLEHSVWPYLLNHIEFLKLQRNKLRRDDKENRIGINFSIILATACLVEGKIEYDLKTLVKHRRKILFNNVNIKNFYTRRIYASFISNMEDYLINMIAKNTGVENWEDIIKLLSYKRTPSKLSDYTNWEGIIKLFNFRNVLAHGREVSAQRVSAWYTNMNWKDEFVGGYKSTEDYLFKKKLVKKRFIKKGSIEHLFTNKVADHFYSISKEFMKYFSKIINQEKKKFTFSNITGI